MQISERRLPHLYAIGQPLFVTFRLHGSLPSGREFPPESVTSGEAFLCVDRLLDGARVGPTYLAMPPIAQIIVDSLQYCGGPTIGFTRGSSCPTTSTAGDHANRRSRFIRRLKGYTARQANSSLSDGTNILAGGKLRSSRSHGGRIQEYRSVYSQKPVKAGLARSAEEYRWSSAYAEKAGLHARAGLETRPTCGTGATPAAGLAQLYLTQFPSARDDSAARCASAPAAARPGSCCHSPA